jgi:pimeloyl-ACP methyl ester carboxylesterase
MREGSIATGDGRRLAYAEFGDPGGRPVILGHGSAESCLVEVEPAWTAAQGVRVIALPSTR